MKWKQTFYGKNLILLVVIFSISSQGIYAQDPVFSQPYLSPVYLNPAATGAGDNDLRVSLITRKQWLSIPSDFNYTVMSVDKFFPSVKCGFGLMTTRWSEGYLVKTGLYGTYSYTVCSEVPAAADNGDGGSTWFATGALQAGLVQRRIDYSQLVFADQLNSMGIISGVASEADPPIQNKKWYPDFAAGLYFHHAIPGNGILLFGGSARHINKPDESLTSTSDTFRAQLPVLWSGSASLQFSSGDWNWGIAALYYRQAQYNTFQIGFDVMPVAYNFSVGFWGHFSSNFTNPTGLTVNIAYNFNSNDKHKQHVKLGYAQDFLIANNSLSYTTGSAEFGMVWDYDTNHGSGEDKCKPIINTSACPVVTQ